MTRDIQPRSTRDGPFCWQSKEARRLIRQRFEESNCVSSALSIYDALCELASDAEAESFPAATLLIANTSGLGKRTAQQILPRLKSIGLIDIAEQTFPGTNMDAPSIYTLLPLRNGCAPLRNGCAPLRNGCAPLRNGRKQSSLRTSEETEKNTEKKESSEEQKEAKASSSASGAAEEREIVPYGQVFDLFSQLCPSLPRLRDRTDQRRTAIRSRWNAALKAGQDPLARLTELFTTAEASDFIAGRTGRAAFGFDWLLKPANAQKVLENNYSNNKPGLQSSRNGHGRPQAVDLSKPIIKF